MKSHNQTRLYDELRLAGANGYEVSELLPIAEKLAVLAKQSARTGVAEPRVRKFIWLKPLGIGGAGLVVGAFLVIASQSVLPTSWLFPVQEMSDSVAVMMHPEYRATVMMKRAEQVNELVTNHAGSQSVLGALADYTTVANNYKSGGHVNYATFQYCKSRLMQAAQEASPKVSQAIQTSLQELDTT